MRLLHLYSGNLYGGIERVLVTLAGAAPDVPAIDQSFALSYEGKLAADLRRMGTKVTLLGEVRLSHPISVRAARRVLRDRLASSPPDVLLAHSPWALAVGGTVAKRAGVRVALWLHNPLRRGSLVDRIALHAQPDVVVANSEYTAAQTSARVHVDACVLPPVTAPAPLSSSQRAILRQQLGASPADVVIIHASRIEPWKGLAVLVEALGELRTGTSWQLWIAGATQHRRERAFLDGLLRAATVWGIRDRVRLLGYREDVPVLMRAADLYCQPNTEPEPFGVATFEAAAAGLPVVVTEGSTAADLLGPSCGRVVGREDAPALGAALAELIDSGPLRRDCGKEAMARAAQYCNAPAQLRSLAAAVTQGVLP
jgi:glycosyltransferase involved in cell wall biosynthesis